MLTIAAPVNGPSVAPSVRSIETVWLSVALATLAMAVGTAPITLMVTAAGADRPPGPTATKLKLSVPANPAAGV